jgi:hypothetical protein
MTRGALAADARTAIDLSLKVRHTSMRKHDGGTITGTASSVPKFNAAPSRMPDRQHQNAVIRGRIGAYTRWANTEDRYMATRPAREGFYAKFEREVDPEGRLAPQERAKRAEFARKAYYQRLALKSAQARRRRKSAKAADDTSWRER